MNQSHEFRRHRVNPVEIVILLIVTGVFFNSAYSLVYVHDGFNPKALRPMASRPISDGRNLASVAHETLVAFEIPCNKLVDENTQANKIRLKGAMCDHGNRSHELINSRHPLKSSIINQANQVEATVFADPLNGKYSTDYIPLNNGSNRIELRFAYPDGKLFSQEILVNKD